MSDTSADVKALAEQRHGRMSAIERLQAAASMFDVARVLVEASLPAGLSAQQRRLALAQRFYATELPRSALKAFAEFQHRGAGDATDVCSDTC